MQIGDICNFSIEEGNHVAKVEIMDITLVGPNPPYRELFKCRRLNNGSVVLAWKENLSVNNQTTES